MITYHETYPSIIELQDTTFLSPISSNTCRAQPMTRQEAYICKRVFSTYESDMNPVLKTNPWTILPSSNKEEEEEEEAHALKTNGYVKLSRFSPTRRRSTKRLKALRGLRVLVYPLMSELQKKTGGEILRRRAWSWRKWGRVVDRWKRDGT